MGWVEDLIAASEAQLAQGEVLLAQSRLAQQEAALTQSQTAALLGEDPTQYLRLAATGDAQVLRFAGTGTTSIAPVPSVFIGPAGATAPLEADPLFGPSPGYLVTASDVGGAAPASLTGAGAGRARTTSRAGGGGAFPGGDGMGIGALIVLGLAALLLGDRA